MGRRLAGPWHLLLCPEPGGRDIPSIRTVVAIPAKNEADYILNCLDSLSEQTVPPSEIIVLVNNTSDDTARRARRCRSLRSSLLHVEEVVLPPHQANAGFARRFLLQRATRLVGPQGIVLTTDADARVPTDWIERNLFWLAHGYDAVCGMAVTEPADEAALPRHLLADDAAEERYTALLDEIDDLVDPRPWDAWPRHTHHSGASIAVRAAVHDAVGGVPEVSHSEDRGFIARLERRDCKIRHDPALSVTVSGRQVGRAEGGMAAAIARRLLVQDLWADSNLERPQAAFLRAKLRQQARRVWARAGQGDGLAAQLGLPAASVSLHIRSPWFGEAWARMEAESPVLVRYPVAMADLPALIHDAEQILAALRHGPGVRLAGWPEDARSAPVASQ